MRRFPHYLLALFCPFAIAGLTIAASSLGSALRRIEFGTPIGIGTRFN
jgi:hypothetical protein